jgi:purine-binding chemotaxis protein CheW
MENQLVVFNLANEQYGVDIAAVDGIVEMRPITAVPRVPGLSSRLWVRGITNLRGEVLPVIDLRKRFGLPAGEVTKETRIVNVEMDGTKVGMIVDAVTEVLRVAEENIEPASPLITPVDSAHSMSGFITGIAKVDERLIILLDLSKVLSTEERDELQCLQQTELSTPRSRRSPSRLKA